MGTRMDSTALSIFDLSPAEKLQLVEDLWDDVAATPEAVPVKRLAHLRVRSGTSVTLYSEDMVDSLLGRKLMADLHCMGF